MNDDFYEDSFEVYNIFLGQKLTILEFHLRFFPEAKLWALVTSLRSQIFAEYFCFYDMYVIKTDPKRMLLFNNCYKTVSGHFFAICIFIFHKTEVQTVILRCLMGLDLNWFKSYGLKCSKTQIFSFLFFCDSVQKHKFAFFVFLGLSHNFCTN